MAQKHTEAAQSPARSRKPGRPPRFSSPGELWEAAAGYFQHVDDNPWMKERYVGGKAIKVHEPRHIPYTISGLRLFINVGVNFFAQLRATMNDPRKAPKEAQEWLSVIDRIEGVIYSNKFQGAAVGVFNPLIIARDLAMQQRRERIYQGNPPEEQPEF